MQFPRLLITAACLLLQNYLSAQDKLNIKFGEIVPTDFDLSKARFDTSAAAVVIAEIGNTSFEGNSKGKGDFSLVYTRFKRIKILKRQGCDIANESITVYRDGLDEEKLDELRASTYNLENGKVVESKLDSKSIFTDKLDKTHANKKFTLPGVKVGSIIEIAYTLKSDFYTHLRAWNFQGEYPILWSEYEVHIPEFFNYQIIAQGDQHFSVVTTNMKGNHYSLRVSGGTQSDDLYNMDANDLVKRWVKQNVAPIKDENFVTTIFNYISRVEFQLNYIQFSQSSERHDYMGNWFLASEKLLKSEYFGATLDEDNRWMTDDIRTITANCKDNAAKTEKIYSFLRDNFSCTSHDALFTDKSLKTVFKTKNGNVAEINLLLVAMLRHEKIDADPVVLSTRDNGYASETYPTMERFNYVICSVKDHDKSYYLDASYPMLGFGHLPIDCYNGMARTINREKPYVAYFNADSLTEQSNTAVLIFNDEKGALTGTFGSTLGYHESYAVRNKIKKSSEKEHFKAIQTKYGSDLNIDNTGIDSLDKLELPVKIRYDFALNPTGNNGIIYFNPMMSEQLKENPFKALERSYPVEMPYCVDDMYTLNMEIPTGYEVDEIPKSTRIAFNETQGLFEYLIQKNDENIQMRARIKLKKANFLPEDYSTLRQFFADIVKKESEQVVFKKKK